TKRELLRVERERAKLDQALGGIKEMGGLPDILFIVDTNKEDIAVQEAIKLGLPVIAVIDSNSSPEGVTYPIPGNDDAMRAISLYCELISGSVLDGLQAEMVASGVDVGELDEPATEAVPETDALEDTAETEAPAAEETAEPAPEAAENSETTSA
ncbi:MAG: 30S ribosomal protein S2, partial [Pseudomonadota bacterium]|nr:30S ribosomal protein S2 [Pseudomonadota bacterium]